MNKPLSIETKKKLVLVKEIYHRALNLSQFAHRNIDKMLAVVQFDLANETALKAIAVDLNPMIGLQRSFPEVIKQVELELDKKGKILPGVIQIQSVHNLRNVTQHHARFPNETELNDCRTYTRDFLVQVFSDVWGESFESISLIDLIKNNVAKNHLLEAEQNFAEDDFSKAVAKSKGAFQIVIDGLADLITGKIDSFVNGIVVSSYAKKTEPNKQVFSALQRIRELIAFQTIGINSQEYFRYEKFASFVIVDAQKSGGLIFRIKSSKEPTKEEAEYVFNFVVNAIIMIESLN